MSTEKMREEFKVWFAANYPKINREETAQDCLFKMIASSAWEHSRAAIEVELPSAYQNPPPYACYEGGWNDMRGEAVDNIESLGLKVKP